MRNSLLVIPDVPDGTDTASHYRDLLVAARHEAAEVTRRLHLEPAAALRDHAAAASTALRELRRRAQVVLDAQSAQEEELVALLGVMSEAVELGEHVLASNDLRVALAGDPGAWEQVQSCALAIVEMSGGAFMSFFATELRGRQHLLQEVEVAAEVPLMHALMRATVAGVQYARLAAPACSAEDRIDKLLARTLHALGPVAPDASFPHLRLASICSTALWNLARIAQRDDLTPGAVRAWEEARELAIEPIRADTAFQQRRLRVVPDYEHCFDVGVAHGIVHPILTRCAERGDVRMPLRADVLAWIELLRSPG